MVTYRIPLFEKKVSGPKHPEEMDECRKSAPDMHHFILTIIANIHLIDISDHYQLIETDLRGSDFIHFRLEWIYISSVDEMEVASSTKWMLIFLRY